jgi:hypothetical protein
MTRIAPAPLDVSFPYSSKIQKELRENIPGFLSAEISLNGENLYKPFFANCSEPEFETVLFDDKKPEVLAFCWYCQNQGKGQLDPKDDAGLIFRVKNIAVGDGQLTRRMLWKTTPERSFYFFGEIHVLDPEVIPSSDRTDFEDNNARDRLIQRCLRVSTILRKRAGEESEMRRFEETLDKGTGADPVASRRCRSRRRKRCLCGGNRPLQGSRRSTELTLLRTSLSCLNHFATSLSNLR